MFVAWKAVRGNTSHAVELENKSDDQNKTKNKARWRGFGHLRDFVAMYSIES